MDSSIDTIKSLKRSIRTNIEELRKARVSPTASTSDVQALLSSISKLKRALKEAEESLDYHYPDMAPESPTLLGKRAAHDDGDDDGETLRVFRCRPDAVLPVRAGAGYDLASALTHTAVVHPKLSMSIPTGLVVAVPRGTYGRIAKRPGFTFSDSIRVDEVIVTFSCREEIHVRLFNDHETENLLIEPGDRIARLILGHTIAPIVQEVDGRKGLGTTTTGTTRSGSSGVAKKPRNDDDDDDSDGGPSRTKTCWKCGDAIVPGTDYSVLESLPPRYECERCSNVWKGQRVTC